MKDDPRERWSPVPDTDGAYSASNLGRVRRDLGGPGAQAGRILRPGHSPKGHPLVNLSVGGRTRSVHLATLIARIFLPPPPSGSPVLIYRDGDPSNCRADNLEWTTQQDVNRKGRWHRKLDDAAREQIREAKGREPAATLAERHGVTRQAIYLIWRDRT